MATGLPPLLLRPHYVEKPWGGRRMTTELQRADFPPGRIGESWEAYDLEDEHGPGACSIVDGGPHDGLSLRALLGGPLPVLLKVIDAREDLSVQVHPEGESGKEEAWVALADGGAVARARAGDVLAPDGEPPPAGRWQERLVRTALFAGSPAGGRPPGLLHVPPGCVHAILAGSLLFEVQNPCDVTWRLDDGERPGLDGRPRDLHLAQAAPLLARPAPAPSEPGGEGCVLEAERFRIDLLAPGETHEPRAAALYFTAPGTIRRQAPQPFDVPAGRTVWLPEPVAGVTSRGWIVAVTPR